jgi:outer membrane protein TolC
MSILRHHTCILTLIACVVGASVNVSGQSTTRRDEVLTLEQAIVLALRDNPQLRNAAIDVSRSDEEYAAARTKRLPSFKLDIIGSQQLTPIDFTFERGVFGTYPGIGPIPADNTRLSTPMQPTAIFITRITQPLSQLYKINLGLKQLRLKNEIAQEAMRSRRQEIVRDVKRAYYALLQTQSALEAAAETIRMYKELDRVTDDYLVQQVVLKSESLDVKSRLAKSEYDIMTLTDQFAVQKQHLNHLLGRDVLTEFSVAVVPEIDRFESDLVAARSQALQQRAELREARLKVKTAEADRRSRKAEYIPDISASYQHIANANFDSFVPKSYMNIGITVSWEIFSWGRKKHELAEKELATQQAQNAVRDAEGAVLIDVNEKFNKLREARQQLAVTQIGRESAVENVRVTTNRYKLQLSMLKDVLQAQAQLEQTNYQSRQALLAFWTAQAEFETAIGEDK